jgi:hypothetical protein
MRAVLYARSACTTQRTEPTLEPVRLPKQIVAESSLGIGWGIHAARRFGSRRVILSTNTATGFPVPRAGGK